MKWNSVRFGDGYSTGSDAMNGLDNWNVWGNHVLAELHRQNDSIEDLEKNHAEICVRVGELRAYFVILGVLAPVLAVIGTAIISFFLSRAVS
jgi:hypothetical protein